MYPEDRVLVGVINRKRDLDKARFEHWYRVPEGQARHGIYAEYVAFFLSSEFGPQNGGIHYFARRTGLELARRRDLLPEEASHSRADARYYKLQLGELREKTPPVLNSTKRPIAFIYTTWDRFEQAQTIADLYSKADQFVDRVFHALGRAGVKAERRWEAARDSDDGGAQLRITCEDGDVIASTVSRNESSIPLPADEDASAQNVRRSVEAILAAIKDYGGPVMLGVPIED